MVVYNLTSFVMESSAAMVLTMYNKLIYAIHEEGFQWPESLQCCKTIENPNIFIYVLKYI